MASGCNGESVMKENNRNIEGEMKSIIGARGWHVIISNIVATGKLISGQRMAAYIWRQSKMKSGVGVMRIGHENGIVALSVAPGVSAASACAFRARHAPLA
jgi:hypothetical protein